jgi:hypothetical protein
MTQKNEDIVNRLFTVISASRRFFCLEPLYYYNSKEEATEALPFLTRLSQMRNALLAVAFFVSVVFSQTVNITGTVTSGGQPIQGAVVKLFVQAAACTSKADGSYSRGGLPLFVSITMVD